MANWAYVENGQVVELYHSLPVNWKNVSNFFALENDTVSLRNLGWYPVQNNTLELQKNQQYGETTYFFDKRKKIVIENTLIVDRPLEDPKILKYNFFTNLRQRRNELLLESDWTQAIDLQNIKEESWKKNWAIYRQQLRDLPMIYEQTYNINMSELDITFPSKPNS